MPTRQLDLAIHLIEQRQNEQAQAVLQGLIRANPQDLTAWSWYVKSFHTSQKRLQALELCLKYNPGNSGVVDAIGKLRGKLLDQAEPTLEHIYVSTDMLVPDMPHSPYALTPNPEDDGELVIESDPIKVIQLDEAPQRAFLWYDVWWLAVKNPTQSTYNALLQDPLASVGRAFGWMFLAALVSEVTFVLSGYLDPRYQLIFSFFETMQHGRNGSIILVVSSIFLLMLGAGIGVFANMLTAAMYNMLAKSLGGADEGNFASTFYLMAAYGSPLGIIIGVLSMFPCTNLIALGLRLYSFRYNILTIQTIYRLNGPQAVLVVVAPALAVLFLFLLLGVGLAALSFYLTTDTLIWGR